MRTPLRAPARVWLCVVSAALAFTAAAAKEGKPVITHAFVVPTMMKAGAVMGG